MICQRLSSRLPKHDSAHEARTQDIDSSRRVLLEDSHFHAGDDCVVLKSGKDAAGRAFATPTANVLMRNLTLEACSCFKHSHGGLHGGEHWYDGCGGLKVGTEMSGGIENVRMPDPTLRQCCRMASELSPWSMLHIRSPSRTRTSPTPARR